MNETRFREATEMREGGHPREAYDEFVSILQVTSEPAEQGSLLLNMATCKAWLGDFEDAKNLVGQARALFPVGEKAPQLYADFVEASTLAASRQFSGAASKFRNLLSEYSDLLSTPDERSLCIDAQQRLGFALVASREFQAAVPILEGLRIRGVGEQQRIHLYLGIAYSFLEDDRARVHLLDALDGPDETLVIEASCRLGIMEFQAGRFEAAGRFFVRSLREGLDAPEWKKIAADYLAKLPSSTNVM